MEMNFFITYFLSFYFLICKRFNNFMSSSLIECTTTEKRKTVENGKRRHQIVSHFTLTTKLKH